MRLAVTRNAAATRFQSFFPKNSGGIKQHHWSRGFSASADEAPKGIPYSKLTIGIPKETFPREKRVAATPEVGLGF